MELPTIQERNIPSADAYSSTLFAATEMDGESSTFLKQLARPFYFIGRILGSIKDFICRWVFCGYCSKRNWGKAKEIFSGLYKCVTGKGAIKDRTNIFKVHLQELKEASPAAFDRFKHHVAYAIAYQNGIEERAEQEKYANDEWSKIDFERDYFSNIESPELIRAVKSFQEELTRKTKA